MSVVLNERLLDEAVRLSGEKTYARTIERALTELVRCAKARRIDMYAGSGIWEGDLGQMRRDASPAVRATLSLDRRMRRGARRKER